MLINRIRNKFKSSDKKDGDDIQGEEKVDEQGNLELISKKIQRLKFRGYCWSCARTCASLIGMILGVLLFFSSSVLVFTTMHVLEPPCPSVYGRECNQRGVCINGQCECDILFSGADCGATQISGYDIISNEECSGLGFAFPYIDVPIDCKEYFIGGKRQGGWASGPCVEYVTRIRSQVVANDGDLSKVQLGYTIPNCICENGGTGIMCKLGACPVDENGLICGGNGNTSVGLVYNYTNAGVGCQCSSLIAFYANSSRSWFDEPTYLDFILRYNYQFNKLYCGHVERVRDPTTGQYIPNVLYAYSIPSDYKCYCGDDWKGEVCTEGKCPISPNTKRICSGNGHPLFGNGHLPNATFSSIQGRPCTLQCIDGYSPCNGKCYSNRDILPPLSPAIPNNKFCISPNRCPNEKPVRCMDGSCVNIPSSTTNTCRLGYQYGVIDYSQLDQAIDIYKCDNVTTRQTFESCFQNTTVNNNIIGYVNDLYGGILYQTTDYDSRIWQLNFTSPLIYFQFNTNNSNIQIINYNGDSIQFNNSGILSGVFNYDTSQRWDSLIGFDMAINTTDNIYYNLIPAPYNYSELGLFNSSYAKFLVVNRFAGVQVILHIQSASLVYDLITYSDLGSVENGILVQVNTTSTSPEVEIFWFNPLSSINPLSNPACLSNPSQCSWFYDADINMIRTLDYTLYVCMFSDALIVQNSICLTPVEDLMNMFPNSFYGWTTSLYCKADSDFDLNIDTVDAYTFPVSSSVFYNVTIILGDGPNDVGDNITYSLSDFVFLTYEEGITYPCACDVSTVISNETELNDIWWNNVNEKTVTDDNIKIGGYVLYGDTSTGERVLKRGIIGSIDKDANVIDILTKDSTIYQSYYVNTRVLTPYEYILGMPNPDLLVYPFKCPDGTYTDGVINDTILDVDCNCTIYNTIINQVGTQFNCTCIDDDIVQQTWGCICNTGGCICGPPATSLFSQQLASTLSSLQNNDCRCLVYNGWEAHMNTTMDDDNKTTTVRYISVEYIDSTEYIFEFTPENTPSYLVIDFDSCFGNETFIIQGGSEYFSYGEVYNITYFTTNDGGEIGNWVKPCQFYLDLEFDFNVVFTNLTVYSIGVFPMQNITLEFLYYGFSLVDISLNSTKGIDVYASSNETNVRNVLFLGSEGWASSMSLRENPVYVIFKMNYEYYLSSYIIIFKSAGRSAGNFTIPLSLLMSGSNDGVDWVDLDRFSIYIDPDWGENPYLDTRYQKYRTIDNLNNTFSFYRILTEGQPLDLLFIDLFSNTTCTCISSGVVDPFQNKDFGYALKLFDLTGLVNISAQFELYNYEVSNVNLINDLNMCVDSNNCTLANVDVTNNGICNDVIYQAYVLGITDPTTLTNILYLSANNYTLFFDNETIPTELYNYTYTLYISDIGYEGLGAIQMSTLGDDFLSESELITFYNTTLGFIQLYNITTGLLVFYCVQDSFDIIPYSAPDSVWVWIENTIYIHVLNSINVLGNLVLNSAACAAGTDQIDCGPSNRIPVLLPNVPCVPLNPINKFNAFPGASTSLYYRSYVASSLSVIQGSWYANIQHLSLNRTTSRLHLTSCGDQVCSVDKPFKCVDGSCVKNKDLCDVRYTCPGNGCVKLTDISVYDAYRCACAPGFDGDACQYGLTKPETPFVLSGPRTHGSESIKCGGPPPFRIKPPIINNKEFYTNEELDIINNQITGNSAPASKDDIGYHRVMPLFAPFGQVVVREVSVQASSLLPNQDLKVRTTCPCMRRGYRGEYKFINDDISYRNIFTLKPVWKQYTNPTTGAVETFPWTGLCTYDNFKIRCPQGSCVNDRVQCVLADVQYPTCNGRGKCRPDGTCDCDSSYKTFLINNEISSSIAYPYTYVPLWNTTDPTVWTMNNNWKIHSLNQCTARNCDNDNCKVPKGCYVGTPSLGFTDAQVLCLNNGLCATSISECYSAQNLTQPKICSGNGIKMVKDVTNEEYCACGDPISPLLSIEQVTEVTQLKPNGFGGPYCSLYKADLSTPLYWSSWNYLYDQPYFSPITGEELPGIWIKGNVIMGERPEDKVEWDKCCQGYSSRRLCPNVLCRTLPTSSCLTAEECLAYSPTAPALYPCNGHGIARADGTCLCDTDPDTGEGYTYDYSQFDTKGCYKFVKCPISVVSGNTCNRVSQCDQPDEWRAPFTSNVFKLNGYFGFQWFVASGGKGLYTNFTLLNQLNLDIFYLNEQIQQALARTALDVLDAQTAYEGCICYGPNDTFTERSCMVLNDQNYTYRQNYNSPYLLNATGIDGGPGYFIYGGVYPAGKYLFDYHYVQGDIIDISLGNDVTTIWALRLMSYGNATLKITDGSTSSLVCPEAVTKPYYINQAYPIFNWNVGVLGGSLSCVPEYTCLLAKSFPDYPQYCGTRVTTTECLNYREVACAEAGGIFWPEDSTNQYIGCTRVSDPDLCMCCFTSNPPIQVSTGIVRITVTLGDLYIAKIRLYGLTTTVLDEPLGLKETLSVGIKGGTTCQDDRFMKSKLNADKSYFKISKTNFKIGSFTTSNNFCEYYGGYLAVGQLSGSELLSISAGITELQRVCGDQYCWVNAVSLLSEAEVPREVLFDPNCDLWGCYHNFLFYTNNSDFDYSTSYFDYVGIPLVQGNVQEYSNILTAIQDWSGFAFDYYASTYIRGGELKFVNLSSDGISDSGVNFKVSLYVNYEICTKSVSAGCAAESKSIIFYRSMCLTSDPYKVAHDAGCLYSLMGGYVSLYYYFLGQYSNYQNLRNPRVTRITDLSFSNTAPDDGVLFILDDAINCMLNYQTVQLMNEPTWESGISNFMKYKWSGSSTYIKNINNADFSTYKTLGYLNSNCPKVLSLLNAVGSLTENPLTDKNKCNSIDLSAITSDKFTVCSNINLFKQFYDTYCIKENLSKYDSLKVEYIQKSILNRFVFKGGCSYKENISIEGEYSYTFTQICSGETLTFPSIDNLGTTLVKLMTAPCVIPIRMKLINGGWQSLWTSYVSISSSSLGSTTGTLGKNKVLGFNQNNYVPAFFSAYLYPMTMYIRPYSLYSSQMKYLDNSGTVLLNSFPVYLIDDRVNGMFEGIGWIYTTNVMNCPKCLIDRGNTCYWDQMFFSTPLAWKNQFNCEVPDIYIAYPGQTLKKLEEYSLISTSDIYIHQILFIQNTTFIPNPLVPWKVPQCVRVSSNGLTLAFCDSKTPYVCQYDYIKYTVVTGLQGDVCGCSTRTGGAPIPGLTCSADNPLSNCTAYPVQCLILKNYLLGTLEEYAESYNQDPSIYDYQNNSLIFGLTQPWLYFEKGYSSRPGQTSTNVDPSVNWIDFCLTCNYPVDCKVQVNPYTNKLLRRCASKAEYCNKYLNDSQLEGPLMQQQYIPELLRPVASSLSKIDPTCGTPIELYRYIINDRYGGPQTDILLNQKLLESNENYIKTQISTSTTQWYNSGKVVSPYVFEWNLTTYISGYYRLDLCTGCTSPKLEIMIYPINVNYEYPLITLRKNVTLLLNQLALYETDFTVDVADTDTYTVNGEVFPLHVFKGVGYQLYDVPVGTILTLYNPVLVNDDSRSQCETRELPQAREPDLAIDSTAPNRQCILTEEDQVLYPGHQIGECSCDPSSAGKTCDCPKVVCKYKNCVCGGFGDENALVLGYDGVYYVTGSDTEAGCFVGKNTKGKAMGECKTVDLGRAIFTLLVENAIFDYPSVYVAAKPERGSSIFRFYPNNLTPETITEARVSCASQGMLLPYFYTLDEINQFVVDTTDRKPVFINVDTAESNSTHWPWADGVKGYFMFDPVIVDASAFGTCSPSLSCSVVNINNFAYLSTVTPAGASATNLHDGDTNTDNVNPGSYTVTWGIDSSLEVNVTVFWASALPVPADAAITCLGGVCGSTTTGYTSYWVICRCPARVLTLVVSTNPVSEIQIFNEYDIVRSSSYNYN